MHTRRGDHSRRASGFSLLEVMIALSILAVGILGATAAQITSTKFTRDARVRTEAAYLAEQQMEAFHAMDGAAIEVVRTDPGYPNDSANPIDPDPNDNSERSFNRSWAITPDTPENGVYAITVTVSWVNQQGKTLNMTLSSVKTDS